MKPAIRFKQVNTDDEREELRTFAKSFDHILPENGLPVIRMYRGERLIGYFILMHVPIVISSFHTDTKICSHRDFKDSCEQIRAWQSINRISEHYPAGQAWFAIDEEPSIRVDILTKLGLRDQHAKLYQYVG